MLAAQCKGQFTGRAPSREFLKKKAASSDPLSPSLKWLFPCPGERQWSAHHSIRTSLARRSSRRSPASKGVQGECLPALTQHLSPLRERLPFPFPPSQPLFPWLPWEATGHLCWAAVGPVMPCFILRLCTAKPQLPQEEECRGPQSSATYSQARISWWAGGPL